MVAAEAAAESREMKARAKAAAWAWYQRSGGSVAPSAGRSEAFAVRCATRQCTSRFQREAASRSRALATLASTVSDSALTSFSSIDNSSFLSQCTASFGDVTDPDESSSLDRISNLDQISNMDDDAEHDSSLDIVALHPRAACWDCGSSLFDSFELVAMSKKLDAELHEANINSEQEAEDPHIVPCSSLGMYHNGIQQQQVYYLQDTPHNSISPPSSPPRLFDDDEFYKTCDSYDKLISVPDKHSKQAVYDMFCRYGDASKYLANQTSKQSATDVSCGDEPRKQKPRPGLMSFHGLAKALHNIRHASSHGIAGAQEHHHHHHAPYGRHQKGKTLLTQGNGVHRGASRLGERILYDDAIDKGQKKERHIHHHHHHHYHYLFHSDDDFGLQSLDKSLMVAAAGLRSPKVNPALSSYLESPARMDIGMDYRRKWADLGSVQAPVGSNFNNEYTLL